MSDFKIKLIFSIIYLICAGIFIWHLERPTKFENFESIKFTMDQKELKNGDIKLKLKIKEID